MLLVNIVNLESVRTLWGTFEWNPERIGGLSRADYSAPGIICQCVFGQTQLAH